MLQVESVCQYDGSFEGGVLKEGHSVTLIDINLLFMWFTFLSLHGCGDVMTLSLLYPFELSTVLF